MLVKIRGISYHYEIHQEQEKYPFLLMLHGFMGSSKSFDSLIPALKSFCNPVTIDLLGHGNTEGSEMHYRFSAKEQVADLSKLIAEQLPFPVILLGYSMGGRLALQCALHRPDLFEGLILESTTFGIENPQEKQARQSLDSRRADDILGNFPQFLKEWEELPLFTDTPLTEQQQKAIRDIQSKQDPLAMSNSLLGFGTGTMPCVKDRLSELQLPVKLIAGARDAKFVGIMNAMARNLNDVSMSVIKGAGHRVHLEQPEQYIAHIKEFIQTNGIS